MSAFIGLEARICSGSLPKITPYPLEDVARAQRDLESGETIGKLVLVS